MTALFLMVVLFVLLLIRVPVAISLGLASVTSCLLPGDSGGEGGLRPMKNPTGGMRILLNRLEEGMMATP